MKKQAMKRYASVLFEEACEFEKAKLHECYSLEVCKEMKELHEEEE